MTSNPGGGLPIDVMGTGPVRLLFVHGFLDAGRIWDPVRRRLADWGLASAAIDLPGMGGGAADPTELSYDRYADSVASTASSFETPVVLVGQSMGAPIVELAALRTIQVSGLVLLTPVPLGGVGLPNEMLNHFRGLGSSKEAQREQRVSLSHSLPGHSLDDLVALASSVGPEVNARLVDIWNDGHPLGRAQSGFAGPVLVVRGREDPFVTKEMATAVAARFSTSRSAAIEAAGHWAHVEQPVEVAGLVAGFVGVVGAPATYSAPAADWKGAFASKTEEAFGGAFAKDIVLEASTLIVPVRGRESVQKVMAAASSMYSSLVFDEQATHGDKQYVEWVATAHEGVEFAGVTVLTRNEVGEICHVAIHHRPMEAAIFFSGLMGEKLKDVLPAGHFLEPERFMMENVA